MTNLEWMFLETGIAIGMVGTVAVLRFVAWLERRSERKQQTGVTLQMGEHGFAAPCEWKAGDEVCITVTPARDRRKRERIDVQDGIEMPNRKPGWGQE